MSGFETLKFFATAPHPCSYLDGQEATTLFVEPSTDLDQRADRKACRIGISGDPVATPTDHIAHIVQPVFPFAYRSIPSNPNVGKYARLKK